MIPAYCQPLEDETLFSWISFLTKLNGLEDLNSFYRGYLNPTCREKQPYIKWDERMRFSDFGEMLENESLQHLYLTTTNYGAIAPFLSSGRQIRLLDAAFRFNNEKRLTRTPQPFCGQLRRCPQCMDEDLKKEGRWYHHRTHQMPEICVCPKHGCLLEYYTGNPGYEYDNDAYVTCKPLTSVDVIWPLAKFADDLLQIAPDGNMELTKVAFVSKIQQLGYYNPNGRYAILSRQIKKNGFSKFFTKDVHHYLNYHLNHISEVPISTSLVLAYLLYGSAESFAVDLSRYRPAIPDPLISDIPYVVVGDMRRNLLELEDPSCGYRFCIPIEGLVRGWGCPKCDSDLSIDERFYRVVDLAGNGEYTPVSSYRTMENTILVKHECGQVLDLKAREFIHEGIRCNCGERWNLAKKLNGAFYDELSLPRKEEKIEPVLIKEDRNCSVLDAPVFQSTIPPLLVGGPERFAAKVWALVGEEYSVIGPYQSNRVKVKIRHNSCGAVDEYYPGNFTQGQRCKKCRPIVTEAYLSEAIGMYSNGVYCYAGAGPQRKIRVRNTQTGEEHVLLPALVLQELQRPTPSRLLPLEDKDNQVGDQSAPQFEIGNRNLLWEMLKREYVREKFIFLDEFSGNGYKEAKDSVSYFVSLGRIQHIAPGIYAWNDVDYTVDEMIEAKYCRRKSGRIGYTYGHSFAHELGLSNLIPSMKYITTMKEAKRHGRTITMAGIKLHVRGSKVPISQGNYKMLQFLDFLENLGRYIECDLAVAEQRLHDYAIKEELYLEDAVSLFEHYPSWVEKRAKALLIKADHSKQKFQ